MKLIFLDIDGVLTNHYNPVTRERAYSCCPENVIVFNEMMTRLPEVKIFISSVWRHNPEIVKHLVSEGVSEEVVNRIIGVTPDFRCQIRGIEIQAVLDNYVGKVEKFVILDDDSDMGELNGHLVQTDSDIGLTWKIAEEVIDRFER